MIAATSKCTGQTSYEICMICRHKLQQYAFSFKGRSLKKEEKKRQNPSVGKYVRMRITAKAGETYNILETGKCNLGL
jgi:hypothetical protein